MSATVSWGRAVLFFLAAYLAIGAVWYAVEETLSPLAASAVSLALTVPAYSFGSRVCMRFPRASGALLLGAFWCLAAVLVDVILWIEPLGVLSGPLQIEFSAEQFYMERYFPYLLLTYVAMFAVPIASAWRARGARLRGGGAGG